jgi:hypothetical protein
MATVFGVACKGWDKRISELHRRSGTPRYTDRDLRACRGPIVNQAILCARSTVLRLRNLLRNVAWVICVRRWVGPTNERAATMEGHGASGCRRPTHRATRRCPGHSVPASFRACNLFLFSGCPCKFLFDQLTIGTIRNT